MNSKVIINSFMHIYIGSMNNIVISGPLKTVVTPLLCLYISGGGFIIAVIATEFDDNHRILSPRIIEASKFKLFILCFKICLYFYVTDFFV